MISKLVFLVGILVGIGVQSCSSPTEPKLGEFIYPMNVGNGWTYEYTFNEPGTKAAVEYFSLRVTQAIEADTVFQVCVYHGVEWTGDCEEQQFYYNRDDGLFVDYVSAGVAFIAPKQAAPEQTVSLDGHEFASVREMFRYLSGAGPLGGPPMASDANELEQTLAYPLNVGTQWTYNDHAFDGSTVIEKKITAEEKIKVPAGSFRCYRVEWIYTGSFSDISIVDHIAPIGLVRREVTAENVQTQDGTQTTTQVFELASTEPRPLPD